MGGNFTYDTVKALRINKDFKSFILGVDVNKNVEKWFLDKFEVVPRADISSKDYVRKLISLCKKYKINIVIPCSENETIAISKHEKLFYKNKILTSVSSYKTVQLINDKGKLYSNLKLNNLMNCEWYNIDSFEEAELAINKFRLKSIKTILKPRLSSGSRGILVIDERIKSFKSFLSDRFCGTGSWKVIQNELNLKNNSLDKYIAMPYFEGETYDVDCIASNGNLIEIVPRLRIYKRL